MESSKLKNTLICAVIFVLCLNACKNRQESEFDIKTIDLDNISSISNHIDTVFFVKLENNQNALITDKPRIQFYDSLIYVKNIREDKIFIYNRNGKDQGKLFDCLEKNISTDGKYFVTTLQAHYCNMFKKFKEQGGSLGKYEEQIVNFNMNVEDNPILCFLKLKE